MKTITVQEFHAALKAQGVPRIHIAMRCPMCGTVQSMDCLIRAGAGKTEADVEKYVGFSCVGRWTRAGSPRKDPDGKPHPIFEVATPDEAQALMRGKESAS